MSRSRDIKMSALFCQGSMAMDGLSEFQKYFSHMVTSVAKPMIVESMTPFQIGAIPGHRAQEHLYTIKKYCFFGGRKEGSHSSPIL